MSGTRVCSHLQTANSLCQIKAPRSSAMLPSSFKDIEYFSSTTKLLHLLSSVLQVLSKIHARVFQPWLRRTLFSPIKYWKGIWALGCHLEPCRKVFCSSSFTKGMLPEWKQKTTCVRPAVSYLVGRTPWHGSVSPVYSMHRLPKYPEKVRKVSPVWLPVRSFSTCAVTSESGQPLCCFCTNKLFYTDGYSHFF